MISQGLRRSECPGPAQMIMWIRIGSVVCAVWRWRLRISRFKSKYRRVDHFQSLGMDHNAIAGKLDTVELGNDFGRRSSFTNLRHATPTLTARFIRLTRPSNVHTSRAFSTWPPASNCGSLADWIVLFTSGCIAGIMPAIRYLYQLLPEAPVVRSYTRQGTLRAAGRFQSRDTGRMACG